MLALLLTMAVPALPAPDNVSDLRCIAVLAMMANEVPEASRADIASAAMFYRGRIEGRTPGFDIEASMRPLFTPSMVGKDMAPDIKRCGDELIGFPGILQKAGESLLMLVK